MKLKLVSLSILIILGFSLEAEAQCNAPKMRNGMEFNEPKDYRKQDAFASKCVNWLLAHPGGECEADRDLLNAFVLVWLSGHPDFVVDIKKESLPFLKQHPELLYPMLHGMAKYELNTLPSEKELIKAHVSGLSAVVDHARALKLHKSCDSLKKLCKASRKEKLAEYVAERVKETN